MVVGRSRHGTLDPGFVLLGTRQQGVPVILRGLVLPGGFDKIIETKSGFIYATTAASPTESSYGTFCDDPKIPSCLADLYSYDWIVDSQTVCPIQIYTYIYLTYLIQYQITLDI
ncbi:unnamed protein product [Schistosoma margrebowiei]|uniref:Uncharacterized protein n=1 Tax=Schistosoma margrebowiei TaxID=48269 RepID=A0A183LPW5_9TREM|nr:unnamed protein product [Schistosoma margrebowiei]